MDNFSFNVQYRVRRTSGEEFVALPVLGDGTCMFRSCSYFLNDTDVDQCNVLRAEVVHFIRENGDRFASFVDDNDVERYCDRMAESGEFGDHIVLESVCFLKQVRIEINRIDFRTMTLHDAPTVLGNSNSNLCVRLMYHGLHYWPLIAADALPISAIVSDLDESGATENSNRQAKTTRAPKRKRKTLTGRTEQNKKFNIRTKTLKDQAIPVIPAVNTSSPSIVNISESKRKPLTRQTKKNQVNDEKPLQNQATRRVTRSTSTTSSEVGKQCSNTSEDVNIISRKRRTLTGREEQRCKEKRSKKAKPQDQAIPATPDDMSITSLLSSISLDEPAPTACSSRNVRRRAAQKSTLNCGRGDINEAELTICTLGPMDKLCRFCKSKNFASEIAHDKTFTSCCHKGKSIIDIRFEMPDLLRQLLTTNDSESKNFRVNIRNYNSALAFASFGADKMDCPSGVGPYSLRINGNIYHKTSNLKGSDGRLRYAQLYFVDSDEATDSRISNAINKGCQESVMRALDGMLREENAYAREYKNLREFEMESRHNCEMNGLPIDKTYSLCLLKKTNFDQRRYNLPTATNEIACVFQDNDDSGPPVNRDIQIHARDGNHIQLSILSTHTDPMVYPFLYPYGGNGWHANYLSRSSESVTQLQYYAYVMAVREEFSAFLHSGKLSQQFFIDAYCKTEANRLNYVRTHQSDLRLELYQGLYDYMHTKSISDNLKIGKAIILPTTFIGSKRNMAQNYQDAMALISVYGKPDLFVTFTCNSKWDEITDNLEPYETASDRPDLTSRVFHGKLKQFKEDILNKHVLGRVIVMVYVIEFQKRGLPHCHMLLILDKDDKIRTAADVDLVAVAEIPDAKEHPRLYEIVKKFMIHGPCGRGASNSNYSACMENNKCTKNFPKAYRDETNYCDNNYPLYRRPRDGHKIEYLNKDGSVKSVAGNEFVVPFNKYLLLKYQAHINVEICSTIKSVKYLYKYVYKGMDAATATIRDDQELVHDEIEQYINTRYISAQESCWRLREYKMHRNNFAIIRLAVHLENQQPVCFQSGNEEAALESAARKNSTLTAWFVLNANDSEAKEYFYHQTPQHYVLTKNVWNKRRRYLNVIGRMYVVNPLEGERYYLRLLLLHRKGITGFRDMKTIEGVEYGTFQEAARALNLLEDDTEWDRALTEAENYQFPHLLRQLFVTICVFCTPTDPFSLWAKHKQHLMEDFLHECNDPILAEKRTLVDLYANFQLHNKKCSDYNLPDVDKSEIAHLDDEVYDVVQEQRAADECEVRLNEEQAIIYREILCAIYGDGEEKLFFINSPGGTGKTYLYNALMHKIRGNGDIVVPVAWTGIAASLLRGGRTSHSVFKLPFSLDETSTSSLRGYSKMGKKLKDAKLIIWDEITLCSFYALNVVDKLLQEIMSSTLPFGGKIMLFAGDFMQCLPIVKHGTRNSILSATIKSSRHWHRFKHLQLTRNMRVNQESLAYADWLLTVGRGSANVNVNLSEDNVAIPSECVVEGDANLITEIFGESFSIADVDTLHTRAILTPKNDDAFLINNDVIKRLRGDARMYFSIDKMVEDETAYEDVSDEFLHSITPTGLPPHSLALKVGAVVMLLRNINTKHGLCNGTRLIVLSLERNLIVAKIMMGEKKGNTVFIPRIALFSSKDDLPFVFKRVQFPIRLSFCMTINKAQGQTFEKVGLYLPNPVFGHGQLYVALSRARSFDNMKVQIFESAAQGRIVQCSNTSYTKNIVYPEIFE